MRRFFLQILGAVPASRLDDLWNEYISFTNKIVVQYSAIRDSLEHQREDIFRLMEENKRLQRTNAQLAMKLAIKEIEGKL